MATVQPNGNSGGKAGVNVAKVIFALIFIGMAVYFFLNAIGGFGSSVFTLRVTGTPGTRFSGSYMTFTARGSKSQSVEGTVPEEYQLKGSIISCAFQKQEEFGILRVEIIKDGKVINQSETSAAYGVVSVASQ